MAEFKYLPNAPITEALIDIRAKLPSNFNVHAFKELHEDVLKDFPLMETQKEFSADFKLEKDKPSIQTKSEGVRGYIYKSQDKKNIVQFRRDGFTFNRLKPYTNWGDIIDKANKLWPIYTKHSNPIKITRIATRYINKINLPHTTQDFSIYMTSPPNNPSKEDFISGYLNRLKLFDPKHEIEVNITQSLEKGTEKEQITFLLDIDAYVNKNYDPYDPEIWDLFGNLRKKKNSVFFSSLTDNAIDLHL